MTREIKVAEHRSEVKSEDRIGALVAQVLTHAEWTDAKEDALFGVRRVDKRPGLIEHHAPTHIQDSTETEVSDGQATLPGLTPAVRKPRARVRKPVEAQPSLPADAAA